MARVWFVDVAEDGGRDVCVWQGVRKSVLGVEFEGVGNERPIQGCHPIGDVVAFVDPGLVVGVVRGNLDGGVLIDGVVGVPVAKGEFC